MTTDTIHSDAVSQYAKAYETHYASENLREAFALYQQILLTHPETLEAGYAKTQIQIIVNAVVSKEARLKSQIDLATAVFEKSEALNQPMEQSDILYDI